MAKVVLFSWYNPQKATEVGAVWNQQAKTRASAGRMKTLFGPIDWLDGDGGHSITIFEVPNDKVYDGLFNLMANMRPYMAIEGYRYETKFAYTPEDAPEIQKAIAGLDAKTKK
jgi:hypothetical protein